MKIKEICEKTGLTDRTVRYYIEEGLITPFYTENYLGRKSFDFSDNDLIRLKNIATLRAFGFSIDEIKQLSCKDGNSQQIIETVKKRTGDSLDESKRILNVLLSIDESDMADISVLAEKLSRSDMVIENESKKPKLCKRLLLFMKACAVFLIVWLPIILPIAILIMKISTLHMPVILPMFLVGTLLCFLPSMVSLFVFQKLKRSRTMLRIILTSLCILCLPLSVFFSSKSVVACEHNYEKYKISVQPTCQAEGEELIKCQECGTFETRKMEKLSHSKTVTKVSEPTCTNKGKNLIKCEMCGKSETQTVEKLPHSPTVIKAILPSCTVDGLSEGSHCSVCKTVLSKQTVIPATGHSYTEREVQQTCGADGGIIHECVCGYSYKTDVISATNKHNFQPNSNTSGYTCNTCGIKVVQHGNADGTLSGGNNNVKYYVKVTSDELNTFEIVIHGNGNMPDFSKDEHPPWYDYLDKTVQITIAEGITSIGKYAFYYPYPTVNCNIVMSDTVKIIELNSIYLKMNKLIIGSGVTSVESNTFNSVNSLYIPKSVKKLNPGVLLLVGNCFYEGTLNDFYKIKTDYYNSEIPLGTYIANLDDALASNIFIYVEAKDISDKSHYWK